MADLSIRYQTLALTFSSLLCLFAMTDSVKAEDAPQGPPAMPVIVTVPEVREMIEYDEFTGRFEAFQEVEVRARVSGYLEKIHFEDGQEVEVGDALFSIDPRPYQALVDVAKAELARTESQRSLAAQEVSRATRLVKKKAMSQEELDTRRASLRTANANIEAAKAALRTAELDLEYTEIIAPISGRISDRQIDIGNLIQNGGGQVLTTIVSQEPVYFIFDVAESDYLKYQRRLNAKQQKNLTNGALSVNVRLLDETEFVHTGKLNFIDTRLDQGTSTIRLRAIFDDNADGLLLSGIFGRVQIPVSEKKATMLLPDKAILSDMGNKIVMTVNDENIVVPKPVQLGSLHGDMRVIQSGLEEADRVIIEGIFRARPGAPVIPQTADQAASAQPQGAQP